MCADLLRSFMALLLLQIEIKCPVLISSYIWVIFVRDVKFNWSKVKKVEININACTRKQMDLHEIFKNSNYNNDNNLINLQIKYLHSYNN